MKKLHVVEGSDNIFWSLDLDLLRDLSSHEPSQARWGSCVVRSWSLVVRLSTKSRHPSISSLMCKEKSQFFPGLFSIWIWYASEASGALSSLVSGDSVVKIFLWLEIFSKILLATLDTYFFSIWILSCPRRLSTLKSLISGAHQKATIRAFGKVSDSNWLAPLSKKKKLTQMHSNFPQWKVFKILISFWFLFENWSIHFFKNKIYWC